MPTGHDRHSLQGNRSPTAEQKASRITQEALIREAMSGRGEPISACDQSESEVAWATASPGSGHGRNERPPSGTSTMSWTCPNRPREIESPIGGTIHETGVVLGRAPSTCGGPPVPPAIRGWSPGPRDQREPSSPSAAQATIETAVRKAPHGRRPPEGGPVG